MPVKAYGGNDEYQKTIKRDEKKYQKSKDNGITILYFSYERKIPKDYIDTIYTNENKLIKKIKEHDN